LKKLVKLSLKINLSLKRVLKCVLKGLIPKKRFLCNVKFVLKRLNVIDQEILSSVTRKDSFLNVFNAQLLISFRFRA